MFNTTINTDPKQYAFIQANGDANIQGSEANAVIMTRCTPTCLPPTQFHELTINIWRISLEAQFARTVAKWINTTINYYLGEDCIVIMLAINCIIIIEVCGMLQYHVCVVHLP